MEVLIGTNNKFKFKEFEDIFKTYAPKIKLLRLSDVNIADSPEEDCPTLMENAIKKVKYFAEKSGLITIADDTGLFVDALNGDPGMNAKRWHEGTDHDRCLKILERLKDVPIEKRSGRYIGAVAAYNPKDNSLWTFQGGVEGSISDKFGKEGGFGYDRIFWLSSMNKYYSELTIPELVQIGDRGKAIKELITNTNFLK